MLESIIDEFEVAERIANGDLPSPTQFCNSTYWAIRISGTGCAWRQSVGEFCWREPDVWLSPKMCARASCLLVLIDHPEVGVLNSPEFAARCVGMTVHAFIKGDELWAIARILDSGANRILEAGAYEDTSPAVQFSPGTVGARIEIDGHPCLIESSPILIDHIALCAKGVWTRDGEPGVETTNELEAA